MKINLSIDREFTKPREDYPYSSSSKVFQTNQLFLYQEKLEPGKKSSIPHFHEKIDEVIFVTSGELIAFEGEAKTLLKKGDSVLFEANSGVKHFLENISESEAEFLLFRQASNQGDVIT